MAGEAGEVVEMTRRGFLKSCLILASAPAIVRADSLMRIIPKEVTLYVPNRAPLLVVPRVIRASLAGIAPMQGNQWWRLEGDLGARMALRDSLRYYEATDVQVFIDTATGQHGELIVSAEGRFNSLEYSLSEEDFA